jgi:CHAD domain-containing protein
LAYRLDADERLSRALARVATEQIRAALSSVARLDRITPTRVHKARQSSKKLRALFRLIRPTLERAGTYQLHDDLARTTGRAFSTQRDADVMLESLTMLERQHQWAVDDASMARIRKHLAHSAGRQRSRRELERATHRCRDALGQLADLVDEWRFRSGARTSVQSGYLRTWRTARDRMQAAGSARSPEAFHDWRKHVKYHLYHLRLVNPIVEEDLSRKSRDAYRLQKLLGEHHDLVLLDAHLAAMRSPARRHRDSIRELIQETAGLRETQALRIGERLFEPESRRAKSARA